jgi:hypothetical protein
MNHTFEFGDVVKDRVTFTPSGVELRRGAQTRSLAWPSLSGIAVDRVVASRAYRRVVFVGHQDAGETMPMLHIEIAESDDELRRLEAFVRQNHPGQWIGECSPIHALAASPPPTTRSARAMVGFLALVIALSFAAAPTLFYETLQSMPSHVPVYTKGELP